MSQQEIIEVGKALLPYLRNNLSPGELGTAAHDAVAALNRARSGAVTIPCAQHEALMAAAKILPKLFRATDLLMAQLITADRTFMPTKSAAWPPITETNEALAALRAAGILEEE